MNVLALLKLVPVKAWLLLGAIAAVGAFVVQQRDDAVEDERTKNELNDQRGAITVHETAREATDGIGPDTDPDSLLRETGGLRDDGGGVQ